MEELINKIKAEVENLNKNLTDYQNGNKSAGRRARKATVTLGKLFKEFRAKSVGADKQ